MKSHSLTFTGAVIERGFWLYVWHVTCGKESIVYVGRTGDSSSQFAASPFNRLGQHLDVRKKATAKMLLRHMRERNMDAIDSTFRLVTVGPIYPEQETIDLHRRHRDVVAAMEAALGQHMRTLGYDVVGKTNSKHLLNKQVFAEVLRTPQPELRRLPLPELQAAA